MKQMTTQNIVKNSTEVKENNLDWTKVYATLQESIKTDQYRVFRANNTLFWIRIDSPGVAQMYVFNADSYKNLFRNMKDFAMAMHKAGYKTVYGETHDMNMISLIKRIGFPVEVAPVGTDSQGRQLYRGTVNV
jgi:hypothetical protein